MPKIANIIPAINLPPTRNQIFSYSIPEKLVQKIKEGQEVLIPFQQKKISGVVVSIKKQEKSSKIQLKKILEIVDESPALNRQQLDLADWISKYYFVGLSLVIKSFLPKRTKKAKKKTLPQEIKFPLKAPNKLTPNQEQIYKTIINSDDSVFLLHGVTGSGKTEIYLKVISKVLAQNKQVIILVPEISLTPQTVKRFAERFGNEKIALLHSRLTPSERYQQWQRIKNETAKIIIGPRSAVFSPVKDLGLIIIDEEHDPSYKQFDQKPRYHVRDVAIQLGKIFKCKTILGSATPSIESYYKAKRKEYKLLEMPFRFTGQNTMPKVEIIDMREEFKAGNYSIFSDTLVSQLKKVLNSHRQALLFVNRRGISTFIMCRDCGFVIKCPNCDVPLVHHQKTKKTSSAFLFCHHCNYRQNIPLLCPKCKSQYIKHFGVGTEKVEQEIKKLFKGITVRRMDSDITSKKFVHEKAYYDFLKKKYQILIGTQMIAKGWDIPGVDLVGIISADTLLSLPDFRSAEKTFQLITQVTGRTGRGKKRGKVILQTYNPENITIKLASQHNFTKFFEKEIGERKEFNYPPFTQLIKLVYRSKDNQKAENKTKKIADSLTKIIRQEKLPIDLLGPAPAFFYKKRNQYFWQIILKSKLKEVKLRNQLLKQVPSEFIIDIDPESLL